MKHIKIIPFDVMVSNEATKIYKQLKSENKMVDLADLLIAATALTHNLPLATLNFKHFSKIPNLRIQQPK